MTKVDIYRVGRVIPSFSGVAEEPSFDALVVSHGKVLAIDGFANCRSEWPSAQVHDFADALLIPGLQDAHCHPTIAADERCHISAPANREWSRHSLREMITRSGRSNGWIKVVGVTSNHVDGEPITRRVLDAICPEEPLVLTHANGHTGFVNSQGLEKLHSILSSYPVAGSHFDTFFERDTDGAPNGVIHEQLLFDITEPAISRNAAVVAIASFDDRLEAMRAVQDEYLAHGVTSVTECLLSLTGWDLIEALCQERAGLRFLSYLAIEQAHHLSRLRDTSSPQHQVIGLKTFVDGAFNGGTCMVSSHLPQIHPLQVRGVAQIADELNLAKNLGVQLAVHANGDEAIDILIEAANSTGLSGRIEHGSFIRSDQFVPLQVQGWGIVPFGDYIRRYGDSLVDMYGERANDAVPHKSLINHGIPTAGSSDHPCSILNPWSGILSCTTRQTLSGQVVGAHEIIDLRTAMAIYTSGGAAVRNHRPGPSGTLTPGSDADFTILPNADLNHDLVEEMLNESVIATYVGGAPAYLTN